MTEQAFDSRSPGEMLRLAREQQGLHIAALAAAIKVAPRKLDALEHDRWDELPDLVFVRALAQTVCRTLKIDAAPVLTLLPRAGAVILEGGQGSLNAPFHDRPGRDEPGLSLGTIRPMLVAASVLMVAAVAVYFLPDTVWSGAMFRAAAPAVPASAAMAAGRPLVAGAPELAASVSEAMPPLDGLAGAPASTPGDMAVPLPTPVRRPALPMSGGTAELLQVRTSSASWVEVQDATGHILVSRLLARGESLGLDGQPPLRLTIGNAAGTRLDFRGQAVDLAPSTRDNVARVELK